MELITQIAGLLKGYPIPESWLIPFVRGILVLVLLIVAGVVHWLVKGIFLKQIKRFAEYTKYQVYYIRLEYRIFHRLADFLPVLISYIFLPEILEDSLIMVIQIKQDLQAAYLVKRLTKFWE